MKVKTITCKRIKNLGNYESKTVEMTALLDEDEDAKEQAILLLKLIDEVLYPVEKTEEVEVPF